MKLFWHKKEPEINFDEVRKQELKEIGLCLQEFRQHKNLSLETICEQIHIPIRLLKAMESAHLQELPEPIYTRELLRKYANYLGLNGDEFASHFHIEINEKDRKKTIKPIFNLTVFRLSFNPVYLYFIYIFLIFISVKNLGKFVQTPPLSVTYNPPVQKIDKIETEKIPAKIPENKSPSYVQVVQKQEEKKPTLPKEIQIEIKVQEQSWVRVVVDGKKEFEGVLNKGDQRKWTAKETLTIRAGNAGGVLVTLNEDKPKTLGNLGQVEEVTFKPQES
jgi:cytoskeletal protein RodZ